jgi:hypothetical protein
MHVPGPLGTEALRCCEVPDFGDKARRLAIERLPALGSATVTELGLPR